MNGDWSPDLHRYLHHQNHDRSRIVSVLRYLGCGEGFGRGGIAVPSRDKRRLVPIPASGVWGETGDQFGNELRRDHTGQTFACRGLHLRKPRLNSSAKPKGFAIELVTNMRDRVGRYRR